MNNTPTDHGDSEAIYDAMTDALPPNTKTPELLDALTHLSASAIHRLLEAISSAQNDESTDVYVSAEQLVDMFSSQLTTAVHMLLERNDGEHNDKQYRND